MARSIAVFGAGPGLGRAVAYRYAREGYEVVLVARDQDALDRIADDLAAAGGRVYVVSGDLADTDLVPILAEQIRATTGQLDAFYYAPTPSEGFVPAAELTPQRARDFMPLIFYSFVTLVQQFLLPMIEQGSGAILTAQRG